MNTADVVGRAVGTFAVVVIAVLLVAANLYSKYVEFNEFDLLHPLVMFAQLFGPPILCIIAIGAAIEASVSALLRGRGARSAALWSALVLWIVVSSQIIFMRVAWAP
jgi:hypothetical protein